MLHDMSSDEIMDGLRSGTLQLAVTPAESGGHMTGIEFESLRTYPICLALAAGHPLARLKSIPLEKLASEPLITLNRKNYPGAFSRLEQLFQPLGVRPRVALEVDSSSSFVAAIESRQGVGLAIPVLNLVTVNGWCTGHWPGWMRRSQLALPRRKTETRRLLEKDFVKFCGSLRGTGDIGAKGFGYRRIRRTTKERNEGCRKSWQVGQSPARRAFIDAANKSINNRIMCGDYS